MVVGTMAVKSSTRHVTPSPEDTYVRHHHAFLNPDTKVAPRWAIEGDLREYLEK
jgi:hypothetical protein